ncbi:hypothetical protein [Stutzerimonas nitrititolerans]|uniref:hypothetical protein n=1 Tax=Stutzerimonas nitrititolerans TaxID=2482751 RepID=UPI0028A145FF|nr:hypothetical protein [Stutzerimonas nitrititolerans]
MRTLFKFAAAVFAGSLLAGCGDEDFTGAYRLDATKELVFVLNIRGDEADLFSEKGKDSRIAHYGQFKVSVKGEKLFLDDVNSDDRWVMTRNVDERSLDCLNCETINLKDTVHWKYDPQGPYDLEQLLKEQAREDEEVFNAELEKMRQQALEKDRRNAEAPKLAHYEGDWVYQRTTKTDPLTIMTIWRKSQIKSWSFKFESMDRLKHEVPGFEVTGAGLKIGEGSKAHLYTLSADKQVLTCMDCKRSERWAKSDPNKDLSDRHYARKMAGNP